MTTDDGGHAYPVLHPQAGKCVGMSFRDAAAIAALQVVGPYLTTYAPDKAAKVAYDMAQAMVVEKRKRESDTDDMVVRYEDLPSSWDAREEKIKELQREALLHDGKSIHLVYDRRVTRTKRPISDNIYVIHPGVVQYCRKVTIISEIGEVEVIKDAHHAS